MRLEWDAKKAASNATKHGVTFEEAAELFAHGALYLESEDEHHSEVEQRYLRIGPIARGIVLVVWTERQAGAVRVISARFASRVERSLFREYVKRPP